MKCKKGEAHNHPAINIVDFDFYNLDVFNQCENSNSLLITFGIWQNSHPLLKVIPVEWEHTIPFGILHSPTPSVAVKKLLGALKDVARK